MRSSLNDPCILLRCHINVPLVSHKTNVWHLFKINVHPVTRSSSADLCIVVCCHINIPLFSKDQRMASLEI